MNNFEKKHTTMQNINKLKSLKAVVPHLEDQSSVHQAKNKSFAI